MWHCSRKAQVGDFKQALTLFRHYRRKMSSTPQASEASARIALVRARGCDSPVGGSKPRFTMIVNLSSEPLGWRWLRGAAALACLSGAAIAFIPGLDPFSMASAQIVAPSRQFQMNAMLGSSSTVASEGRPAVVFTGDPEALAKPVITSNSSQIRVQGAVTDTLYWSLRSAGVTPQVAADYLHALSTRIDVGEDVEPYDRFDLVIGRTPSAGGQPLLLAALHRVDGNDVELMKWTANGRTDWFDSDASESARSAGLMAPVAGRITSGFGMRYHPILHYMRMHAGIDFGAAWGSAIVAAADGQVVAAGWTGGYGREVQIAHGGGIVSLYGHMSGFATSAGQMVKQGQVIGYVGSSGLSTGPHVHFEVKVNGTPVDPMTVRMQTRQEISGADRQAFNARLKQLTSIGAKA